MLFVGDYISDIWFVNTCPHSSSIFWVNINAHPDTSVHPTESHVESNLPDTFDVIYVYIYIIVALKFDIIIIIYSPLRACTNNNIVDIISYNNIIRRVAYCPERVIIIF